MVPTGGQEAGSLRRPARGWELCSHMDLTATLAQSSGLTAAGELTFKISELASPLGEHSETPACRWQRACVPIKATQLSTRLDDASLPAKSTITGGSLTLFHMGTNPSFQNLLKSPGQTESRNHPLKLLKLERARNPSSEREVSCSRSPAVIQHGP